MSDLHEPPIRLCCMERHYGPVCADQHVMCQLCFIRVPITDLYVDSHDGVWDCCKSCGDHDAKQMKIPK